MYLKELGLFAIYFIVGMMVVYFGMFIMKSIREVDMQNMLNLIIIYTLFIAIGVNYLRIYVNNKLT